ncbi:hypothetical protein SESBI_47531 [Sesbania bispinosa]|nr:hypothetical protein SESBI_47531 [Sesbania bispinosa]
MATVATASRRSRSIFRAGHRHFAIGHPSTAVARSGGSSAATAHSPSTTPLRGSIAFTFHHWSVPPLGRAPTARAASKPPPAPLTVPFPCASAPWPRPLLFWPRLHVGFS